MTWHCAVVTVCWRNGNLSVGVAPLGIESPDRETAEKEAESEMEKMKSVSGSPEHAHWFFEVSPK